VHLQSGHERAGQDAKGALERLAQNTRLCVAELTLPPECLNFAFRKMIVLSPMTVRTSWKTRLAARQPISAISV
jgi:hypothetical protein